MSKFILEALSMKAIGILIVIAACLGMALGLISIVGIIIAIDAGGPPGLIHVLYFIMAQPFNLIWVLVGIGFVAASRKLDKVAKKS
jgi:hypothetical protein